MVRRRLSIMRQKEGQSRLALRDYLERNAVFSTRNDGGLEKMQTVPIRSTLCVHVASPMRQTHPYMCFQTESCTCSYRLEAKQRLIS